MKKRILVLIFISMLLTLVPATCASAAELKLNLSDGAAGYNFDRSVSISGDYAIMSAFGDDDPGINSSSAYVYGILPRPNITRRDIVITSQPASIQSVLLDQTFRINASARDEYNDTLICIVDLNREGIIIENQTVTNGNANFSTNESTAGTYNFSIRFYNTTHYNNTTTSNCTVSVADIIPLIITNVTNTTPAFDSVTITWDTDENSTSHVMYGTITVTNETAGYYPVTVTVANSSTGKSASITLYVIMQNMSANYTTDEGSNVNATKNASGTKDGLNWIEATVDHISTYVLMGRLPDDGGSTDSGRNESGRPYVTSIPNVLATEVQTDIPVSENMAAWVGIKTENDEAFGIGVNAGTDESTPAQTEKKGITIFLFVGIILGVIIIRIVNGLLFKLFLNI